MSAAPTWRCSACDTYNDAEARVCAVCDTPREAAAPVPVRAPVKVPESKSASVAKSPERPEPTRAEIAAGCGCLLFLAAAAVTLVVLLVINWSSIVSAVTSLGPSDDSSASEPSSAPSSPTPTPTPTAEGPCPRYLTELLPFDAREPTPDLVAVFRRTDTDPDMEYTFCRARSGELFYFGKRMGESYQGSAHAEDIDGGYRGPAGRFVGDELTYVVSDEPRTVELEIRSSPS